MSSTDIPSMSPTGDIIPFSKMTWQERGTYGKEIFVNSIPIISEFIIPILINIISITFLTHYHDDQIVAGFGVGSTFNAIIGIAWIFCLNHASTILISQSFGEKNYLDCGRYFRRSLVIMLPLLVPMSGLLLFSDKIMILFGVNPEIARLGAVFTKLAIPLLVGTACFDCMGSFIRGQEFFYPIIYIQAANLVLHFLWAKIFIEYLHWGIEGAVLCATIEAWTNTLILYIYIKTSGNFTESWGSWDSDVFNRKQLWKQFKFAISVAGTGYLEWVSFEILTIISGNFDARQAVIHIGIANTAMIEYNVGSGLANTMTIFIGISLGEKNITKAKNYCYATCCVLITQSIFFVILLFTIQDLWASWWSIDPLTQAGLHHTAKLYIFGLLLWNSFNSGVVNTLKCIGKQKIAFVNTFLCLYVLGVPLMLFLAFKQDLKVFGVWLGYDIAQFTVMLVNLYTLWRVDWNEVLIEVHELHKKEYDEETVPLNKDVDS